VVLQSAQGEGEIDLEITDGRGDLVGDGGVGRIGRAELFNGFEQGVRFVNVAGVELQVLFVGFVGDFAGLPLHLGEEGGLFVFVFMCHIFSRFLVGVIS